MDGSRRSAQQTPQTPGPSEATRGSPAVSQMANFPWVTTCSCHLGQEALVYAGRGRAEWVTAGQAYEPPCVCAA